MERDVDARLCEAVRFQVGRIFIYDALFLEVGEVGDDVAGIVAVGARLHWLDDRPCAVSPLAESGDFAAARLDLYLIDLRRVVGEDFLLRVFILDRPIRFDEVQIPAESERDNEQEYGRTRTSHLSPLPPRINTGAKNEARDKQQRQPQQAPLLICRHRHATIARVARMDG